MIQKLIKEAFIKLIKDNYSYPVEVNVHISETGLMSFQGTIDFNGFDFSKAEKRNK